MLAPKWSVPAYIIYNLPYLCTTTEGGQTLTLAQHYYGQGSL